jgi:hypothetical protein
VQVGELFVTATNVRVVGGFRHLAAMLLALSMIGQPLIHTDEKGLAQ